MSTKITVVVVDDHPLFREGVVQTLNAQTDIEVIAEGTSADDAVRLTGELLPDIILLDIAIPGGGLDAAQRIAVAYPVTHIVMLTGSEDDENVVTALKLGARAYILKGVSARELTDILRAVCAGEVYLPPALAAGMLLTMTGAARRASKAEDDPSALLEELTRREYEILEIVAAGDSNKEIAQRLHLTEKTVKHHMTNILQKLQVRNRVEAALLAQKAGHQEQKR